MKKLLTILLTVCIILATFLSGCSCAGEESLSFNGLFYDAGQSFAPPSYSEKTEYKVTFKKASNFEKSFCTDCNFTGTYSSELTVLPTYEDVTVGTLPETDLYVLGEENSPVYKLVTKLNLHSLYVVDGSNREFDDYIYRYAYFFPTDKALMPIYVKEETKTGIPTEEEVTYSVFTSETLYKKGKYNITVTDNETDEVQKNKSYSYSKKTLIDNAELLFAIRNITGSASIPVVTPSYGSKQTLAISKDSDSAYSCNLSLTNGEITSTVTSSIDVKTFTFRLSNNQTAGQEHTVKIQKAKTESLPYKSFMVYYSQPLSIMFYNGVLPTNLGNLEFNLTKIVI